MMMMMTMTTMMKTVKRMMKILKMRTFPGVIMMMILEERVNKDAIVASVTWLLGRITRVTKTGHQGLCWS